MDDVLNRAIDELSWGLAAKREDAYRELARDHLPKHLEWLADHPRLLRIAYRLRRKWRPTVYVGWDLGTSVTVGKTRDGTMVVLKVTETFSTKAPASPEPASQTPRKSPDPN